MSWPSTFFKMGEPFGSKFPSSGDPPQTRTVASGACTAAAASAARPASMVTRSLTAMGTIGERERERERETTPLAADVCRSFETGWPVGQMARPGYRHADEPQTFGNSKAQSGQLHQRMVWQCGMMQLSTTTPPHREMRKRASQGATFRSCGLPSAATTLPVSVKTHSKLLSMDVKAVLPGSAFLTGTSWTVISEVLVTLRRQTPSTCPSLLETVTVSSIGFGFCSLLSSAFFVLEMLRRQTSEEAAFEASFARKLTACRMRSPLLLS
mmetsp:Transcript_80122/g.166682  ORF Transcript_80122/g.166682 Transcript_80122/m.166682 type:complete len:268 (-) Transcript_80122:2017-2820(-)